MWWSKAVSIFGAMNGWLLGRAIGAVALIALALLPRQIIAQDEPPKAARVLPDADHERWQAVGRVNFGGFRSRSLCTGTLIAPDLVVTAAHCLLPDRQPENVHFVAGYLRGSFAAHRRGAAFRFHPNYFNDQGEPAGKLGADLALLQLDAPITEVTPLPIAQAPPVPFVTRYVAYANGRGEVLAGYDNCHVRQPLGDVIGLDCPVRAGNSGAPVLTWVDGELAVVGVLVAQTTGQAGIRSVAALLDPVELGLSSR